MRAGQQDQLESLVSLLQHACKVVCPGRTFIRRIYNLTHHFKQHYTVRLNAACKADIEWWCTFFSRWNGTSLLRPSRETNPDHEIWSDASGSLGCGAHWRGLWFQAEWKGLSIATATIAAKESSSPSWWRPWCGGMSGMD